MLAAKQEVFNHLRKRMPRRVTDSQIWAIMDRDNVPGFGMTASAAAEEFGSAAVIETLEGLAAGVYQ